ncbi:MAG: neutral/alkaline non-lysosomal ceramidase N-terminal domain-containing protein [Verrucomicrobiae bacterium]|nr:neutral/alkaline non-lysosomal ceramidase N-terminal domain-containing protein [Verrucomicrobiae bacterium]
MKRILALIPAFAVLFALPLPAQQSSPPLRAGAATSVITPPLGESIVGGFTPFPAEHIHDELHARCLVLDDGKTKVALVVCDLLGMHRSLAVEAKSLIEKELSIPPSHVVISATHTHSATNALYGEVRTYSSDIELTDYQHFVARRIADGVRRALNLLRPAEIAFGHIDVPDHVFNRRWFLKEGTMPQNPFGKSDEKVKMNPGAGGDNLIEPAGPIDPRVSFVVLREPGGPIISLYSAYSLHYVGGVGQAHVSADYFGYYSKAVERILSSEKQDPPIVAMMANGTSGDINNINFREPRLRKQPYEQMQLVADDLAAKVTGAVSSLEWKASAPLDARFRELDVKWRTIPDELMKWARETEADAPRIGDKAVLPLAYAGRVQRLAQASPETKLPVQVLRIGEICIGTSPCETFAETGMEFRDRSPFAESFMVELVGGYYGYMPTPRHFELGGYETWPGTNNLEPQASVKLMDALLEMATEVKTVE